MKKIVAIFFIIVCLFSTCFVQAANTKTSNQQFTSQLVEIKERELKDLQDYTQAYGSESYGLTAFVLNKVRIFSIPCCFIGFAVAAIYQYVIGVRKIDVRDKGLKLMVGFVTLFVICQVLPLIFAVVVKSWRG